MQCSEEEEVRKFPGRLLIIYGRDMDGEDVWSDLPENPLMGMWGRLGGDGVCRCA